MSEQSPYKTLGLAETASFDEIQSAKKKLSIQHKGDSAEVNKLEAAYDAIIMQRLKQRQEGVLEVPDQVRYAEAAAGNPQAGLFANTIQLPQWLLDFWDMPDPKSLNWTLGINGAIAVFSLLFIPTEEVVVSLLTVILCANIYLLFQKERRFGRVTLISLCSLALGLFLGNALAFLLSNAGVDLVIPLQDLLLVTCCATFGLSSSFLR